MEVFSPFISAYYWVGEYLDSLLKAKAVVGGWGFLLFHFSFLLGGWNSGNLPWRTEVEMCIMWVSEVFCCFISAFCWVGESLATCLEGQRWKCISMVLAVLFLLITVWVASSIIITGNLPWRTAMEMSMWVAEVLCCFITAYYWMGETLATCLEGQRWKCVCGWLKFCAVLLQRITGWVKPWQPALKDRGGNVYHVGGWGFLLLHYSFLLDGWNLGNLPWRTEVEMCIMWVAEVFCCFITAFCWVGETLATCLEGQRWKCVQT